MAEEKTPDEQEEVAQESGAQVGGQATDDPSGLVAHQQRAVQAALQASQEQAVRACLVALDPSTRADEGTYAEVLRRLEKACQAMLERLG